MLQMEEEKSEAKLVAVIFLPHHTQLWNGLLKDLSYNTFLSLRDEREIYDT